MYEKPTSASESPHSHFPTALTLWTEVRFPPLARDVIAECGIEMGKGVALDLAVGFFSGTVLSDRPHFP